MTKWNMMFLVTCDTEQLNAPKKWCPLMYYQLFCTNAMQWPVGQISAAVATAKSDTEEPAVTSKQ